MSSDSHKRVNPALPILSCSDRIDWSREFEMVITDRDQLLLYGDHKIRIENSFSAVKAEAISKGWKIIERRDNWSDEYVVKFMPSNKRDVS